MADVQFSIPVLGLNGRLGNSQMVFYTSRGRAFVRAFTPPANPASPDQVAVRSFLAAAAKQWANLTEAQQTAWTTYARTYFESSYNGRLFAPSGAQVYNKIAFFRQAQGLALPTAPPTFGPPPPVSSYTQDQVTAEDDFTFTLKHSLATVTGYKLFARITAPVGPGVEPREGDLRYIKGIAAASFIALPANNAQAVFTGARYAIPFDSRYLVELVILSPESVPSFAALNRFTHEMVR